MSTNQPNLEKIKTDDIKPKKKPKCKCSKCRTKREKIQYVCSKCTVVNTDKVEQHQPDCVKLKRDSQNIFITFLS
jgi:predicted amidophosphoribosyltransferase